MFRGDECLGSYHPRTLKSQNMLLLLNLHIFLNVNF